MDICPRLSNMFLMTVTPPYLILSFLQRREGSRHHVSMGQQGVERCRQPQESWSNQVCLPH
jgi:hypothetical protein